MVNHTDFVHLVEPGESDRTLLLLHGTGGDETDLVPLGRQLDPAATLLSPRGKVLENGVSPRFFRRLAVGELDIPDLLARTDELADFVAAKAGEHGLDLTRLTAIGLSNGANIAVSLLFRRPEVLGAAALLRPMLPYPPPGDLDLAGRPVLIAAGGQDPYVPADQSEELVQQLERHGAEVTARIDPAAGHGLTPGDLTTTGDWLARLREQGSGSEA